MSKQKKNGEEQTLTSDSVEEVTTKSTLEKTIKDLNKRFGQDTVVLASDESFPKVTEVIPTGIAGVDRATKIGGIPCGRTTEIFGPESSGKTTLALHLIYEAQKLGKICAFVDAEYTMTETRMKDCGIDTDAVVVSRPTSGEAAADIIYELLSVTDVVIVDSVAALVPEGELNGSASDNPMAMQARLMSRLLRKVTPIVGKNNRSLVFINQIRSKVGVIFGNPEVTSGGNALKFYSSLRLDLRKKEVLFDARKESYANIVRVKAIKSKIDSPLGEEEIVMFYDPRKTKPGSIIHVGEKIGIIKKSGTWYSYNNESIGQGFIDAVNYLINNPLILEKLEKEIRDADFTQKSTTIADI
jgi:recombination protein RecA